jgi:hypothetical protein
VRFRVVSAVDPSIKVTVPAGTIKFASAGVTVMVKVTSCPYRAGLADDLTVVVVASACSNAPMSTTELTILGKLGPRWS